MKFAAAPLAFLLLAGTALAQTQPSPTHRQPPAQPRQPATPPRTDPVAASYAAMSQADRVSIQVDLIWTGEYSGAADGEFGPRAIAAVKAFQKRNRTKETGILNPKERSILAREARGKREAAGWRVVEDRATGTRLGIPTKLAPQQSAIAGGTRWASAQGEVQVETFRIIAPGTTLAGVYEEQRKVAERKPIYNVLRPDFFVISGTQGLKKIYMRAQAKDNEVRGFSVQYDQGMAPTLDPVSIAMASAFQAFPAGVAVAGPPPRRKVEYGSAVFVTGEGHAVTTRDLVDGCQTFTLAGHGPADLVADDKDAGLALLRIYGARDLKPVAVARNTAASDVTLIGIADPERQGGAGNVSTAQARIRPGDAGQRPLVEPAPSLGFAGAAVIDRQGHLVGVADVRVQVVAGSGGGANATLIPSSAILSFLTGQNVAPAGAAASPEGAKAAVVRVICVRK